MTNIQFNSLMGILWVIAASILFNKQPLLCAVFYFVAAIYFLAEVIFSIFIMFHG